MPTRIVSQVFKEAIADSKLSDGSGDSSLVLVNVSYDQYEDRSNDGKKVFVGRLILAYDMGSSLQACSMTVCYTPTKGDSYVAVPKHPVDEERLEPFLSHNIRAPVVSPMLSALGSRGRINISASSTDQKVVLRCDTSNHSSVTMIVGTTPDPEEDGDN